MPTDASRQDFLRLSPGSGRNLTARGLFVLQEPSINPLRCVMNNFTRFLGPEPSLPAQAQRSSVPVGTTARRTEVPTRPPLTLVEPEAMKNRLIAALPLPVRERWMLLLEVVELTGEPHDGVARGVHGFVEVLLDVDACDGVRDAARLVALGLPIAA